MPKRIYNRDDEDNVKHSDRINNDTYDDTDIRQIIFEHIDDEYSYGKYGNLIVVMMNNNGYINAT
jgi:hypothetical protein